MLQSLNSPTSIWERHPIMLHKPQKRCKAAVYVNQQVLYIVKMSINPDQASDGDLQNPVVTLCPYKIPTYLELIRAGIQ